MLSIDEQLLSDGKSLISIFSDKASLNKNNFQKAGTINYTSIDDELYLTIPNSRVNSQYNRIIQELPSGKIPKNLTFSGNITVEGNFNVVGTQTTISSSTIQLEDNIIELNKNETGDGITLVAAGLQLNRGTKGSANILFQEGFVDSIGAFLFDINGGYKFLVDENGNTIFYNTIKSNDGILKITGKTEISDSLKVGTDASITGAITAKSLTTSDNIKSYATINGLRGEFTTLATNTIDSTGGTGKLTVTNTNGNVAIYTNATDTVFESSKLEFKFMQPISIQDPTASTHAVSLSYLTTLIQSRTFKTYADVATTSNITLSGLQTLDGITLTQGQIALVKNQTDKKTNGLYVVNSSAWTRQVDFNTSDKIKNGAFVVVTGGTKNAQTMWELKNNSSFVLGTYDIDFRPLERNGICVGTSAPTNPEDDGIKVYIECI